MRGLATCLRYSRTTAAAMFMPRIRVLRAASLSLFLPGLSPIGSRLVTRSLFHTDLLYVTFGTGRAHDPDCPCRAVRPCRGHPRALRSPPGGAWRIAHGSLDRTDPRLPSRACQRRSESTSVGRNENASVGGAVGIVV